MYCISKLSSYLAINCGGKGGGGGIVELVVFGVAELEHPRPGFLELNLNLRKSSVSQSIFSLILLELSF